MKFKPIGDKVLLLFPQEHRLENGVIVVGLTDNRADALVIAVGDRVSDEVTVGSTVLANRLDGINLGIDGVRYRLVKESDIKARQEI